MRVSIDSEKLDLLANVISNKSGEAAPMTIAEMTDAVDGIQTGGGEPVLQSKPYTVDSAGTETITADAGYDGLSEVEVSVPSADAVAGGYSEYITQNNVRKWKLSASAYAETGGWVDEGVIDENVTIFNAVPSNTTVTPSTSAQTIGGTNYMMEGAVTVAAMPSGTVGTPTATKGTVSNNSVTVTPSVTNTTGYITGGTKTGTAVSVSASELVSGTINITSSGNTNVTNYATANVASGNATASATKSAVSNHSVTVTPSVTRTAGYITAGSANGTAVSVSASELVSGSQTITQNGTVNVTNLAEVVVNVQGGGGGDDSGSGMQIGTKTTTPSTASASISFTGLAGEPTSFVVTTASDLATGASPFKTAAVVFDGTSLHGQIITNTNNAQVSYDGTNFSKSYSNGTLTITGSTYWQANQYVLVYTYDGNSIHTSDVQVGSGATSITFTGLEDRPDYFSCIFKSNFSTSSGYQRVITVVYDGNSTYGIGMDSGAKVLTSWSYTYNNGSLTITSQGTNNGGYFHQPGYYQLTYGITGGGGSSSYQKISKTYTPTTSTQTEKIEPSAGYDAIEEVNVTVNPMPSGAATAPASISGTAATVTTGTNTLTLSKSVSVTPSVTPGYVAAGTAGNSSVSLTANVTTKAAATYTPSTSTQTISANQYLTGAQTINPIPSQYIVPTGNKEITENGTGIDVAQYSTVSVNVASGPTYTATLSMSADSSSSRGSVRYQNTTYYPRDNATFTFHAGDMCTITSYGEIADGSIYENGNRIGDSSVSSPYTYTLPAADVTMEFVAKNGGICYITSSTITITENGSYDVSDYAIAEVNVPTGGGGSASPKQINFIDYDGTIVESYTKSEWQSVTALPSNPSHSGLTAQGWNWTKAQIDAQLTAIPDGDVWVGQMYITDDGKTRVYIHLEKGRLYPYFGICPNGTVVIDWGDNSATATLTGTSLTTVQTADHEYASAGDYVITLTVSSGSFAFYGVSNTSYILRKDNTTTANIHRVYANAVQKIELGAGANIGNYAFSYCHSLENIAIPNSVTSIGTYAFRHCHSLTNVTIPNNVTSIGTYAFNSCHSLVSITIPSGVTSIGNNAFEDCYSFTSITIPNSVTSIGIYAFRYCGSLTNITIPNSVTSIGNYAFNGCYPLVSITIPNSVTSIGAYTFNNCYSLANITIPSGVTSIGNNAFSACYGMAEYHFLPTTPPTLSDINAFTSIQPDCIIYVPSASLTTYQTATNWSEYASYMRGE